MSRQLKILEHALSGLLRRKYKNLSLLVVYAFTVTTLGSILFLTHTLKTEVSGSLRNAPEIVVQRLAAGRHDLIPIDYIESIRPLPGVENVTPRVWGYYFDASTQFNITLMGLSDEPNSIEITEGRLPATPDECAIGSGISLSYKANIGDHIQLRDNQGQNRSYEISGLFNAESKILTNNMILMQETALRNFFNMEQNMATDIAVKVYNQREVTTLAKKIVFLLPDTRPISRRELLHTYDTIINWRSGMMLTLAIAALIAFFILAWDKASGISADEKQEIGILKAIGWETADVMAVKLWEGLLLSLSAFLIGLFAAWVYVFTLGAPALSSLLKGWSVLFPSINLEPSIDLYQIFVLGFLTIAPYLACTLIPSWKAAITDPEQVMRS